MFLKQQEFRYVFLQLTELQKSTAILFGLEEILKQDQSTSLFRENLIKPTNPLLKLETPSQKDIFQALQKTALWLPI